MEHVNLPVSDKLPLLNLQNPTGLQAQYLNTGSWLAVQRPRSTHRSQGHDQVGVGEEDEAKGQHEAGDEQGQDVAVVVAATCVPVGPTRGPQPWNKQGLKQTENKRNVESLSVTDSKSSLSPERAFFFSQAPLRFQDKLPELSSHPTLANGEHGGDDEALGTSRSPPPLPSGT